MGVVTESSGGLLSGLRVLELNDGVAAACAGWALAELGADVTTLRRRGSGRPVLLDRFDRGKTVLDELPASGDRQWHVVIEDRVAGDGNQEATAPMPALARVMITGFGMDGPLASWRSSELVALAAGGGLAVVVDDAGRPVPTAGWQALISTGYLAALAALDAVNVARETGRGPITAEVAARDAVVFTFTYLECAHDLLHCPGTSGGRRYTAPSGVFQASDGQVRLAAVDEHQWAGARRALGEPEWAQAYRTVDDRRDNADRLTAQMSEWTRTRPKGEIAELMQRHGVPATPVNTPDEVLTSAHLRERGMVDEARKVARSPFGVEFPRADAGSEAFDNVGFWDSGAGRTLSQLTMAEATHVISAPIAGALLGAMGLHIVRFEEVDRLDMYRRIGPFSDGRPGLEQGAYFLAANLNKQSLAFRTPDLEPLQRVLKEADIVLENVQAKRLERWGIDLPQLEAEGRLTLSVSGFGRRGPLASYRAYANNIHAYSGLTDLTRGREGELANVFTVLADIATSLTTALVIAAWSLGPRSGSPADADISMLEVMVSRLADQLEQGQAARTGTGSVGATGASPDDVFATADRHLAVTVTDDDAWTELCTVAGLDPSTWPTAADRLAHAEEVRDRLEAAFANSSAADLAVQLQQRGVPAAEVATPEETTSDPELRRRGLFRVVTHEDRGAYWALCQPWRIVGDDLDHTWVGAPTLGDWNRATGTEIPPLDDAMPNGSML